MSNRIIKFRGLSLNGDWYYGNLTVLTKDIHVSAGHYISNKLGMPFAYAVRPETVGQFTGLHDNYHKEIYDGDLLRSGQGNIFRVLWDEKEAGWVLDCLTGSDKGLCELKKYMEENLEVVGNIYQNPELLTP